MSRSLSFSLVLLIVGSNGLYAQEPKGGKESFQSTAEAQFDSLDGNDDGMLSESELDGFSQRTLGRLRERGLRQGYPLPRDEFVKASVAQMESEEKKDREKEEEQTQPKESKSNELSPPSMTEQPTTGGPTGTRRSSSGKSRFVPSLPSEYLSADKNGDGQIGLYEWDRKRYADFLKLDKNGDGFLTAAELVSKSGAKSGSLFVDSKSLENQDPVEKEARETFARMDSNRDGGIAEDEWSKSQRVRPMFEQAGINASLPMDAETFIKHYRKAKETEVTVNNEGRR